MFEVREAKKEDISRLLELYVQFKDSEMPLIDERINSIWGKILANPDHHVVAGCEDGLIVSTCIIVIVQNLTHERRPFAVIENVITDERYRGKGYATRVLDHAKEIAQKENCYKIMLMTGSKLESTLRFYENAGYNRQDKTAFIQWL